MDFRQFYLGCLAHASYMVGSGGQAAVIDPQRDVDQYIAEAERTGSRIRYIIETHLHADFVSGHRELAERTGAQIVIGARARAEFPHLPVKDRDELTIGHLVLRALETPGHTPEGISWLVIDPDVSPLPVKIFTGDTLFIGDVGRPDLAGSLGFTAEMMAGALYDSLHQKILSLGDDVEVWPAHGAGSQCGRNISSETSSTIGIQRRTNYALQPMSRDQFVSMMTADLSEAPSYFAMDAEINRKGARLLSEIDASPLSAFEFHSRAQGAVLLDVRGGTAFGNGHIAGSINIGLGGQFASWAGTLISPSSEILIIAASEEDSRQAVMRLARVGLENSHGWLDGGIDAWASAGYPLSQLTQIKVGELQRAQCEPRLQVLDVRRPAEFEAGHVPRAVNVPLNELPRRIKELDLRRPTAVICAGGYRSSAAASLLQQKDLPTLYNVVGGTAAWINAGYETER